jgi:xylulokinase
VKPGSRQVIASPLYLGFDASTQHLALQVLEVEASTPRLVFEHTISFDRDLPAYGTRHGVLPHDDPRVVVAPPLVWADALDRAMAAFVSAGLDRARVRAISGSAQQHGSVYLGASAASVLAGLDPRRPLVDQLTGVFSRPVSPVWLDASTSFECEEIARAMGGDLAVARLTGSRPFERFTAAQIRKFARIDPAGYARTARIHLVSSFLASLLIGGDAPLDPGDASGTNLMDLSSSRWSNAALSATAPDLDAKLPAIVPSSTIVGTLAPYWRERYGLPAVAIVAWSGDNPCSLIGIGLVEEGRVGISLGTSDTLFGLMKTPRVDETMTGHVFGAPTGDFMGITVFSNGSLARERVRDAYGYDWLAFSNSLQRTPPGNGGALMLPWFVPEITPHVTSPAVHRLDLDPADGARNARAVVEAQMMSMANHSRWMNVNIDTIHATGGAAANADILRIMADVFDADVYQVPVGNSACLGAALRAWHADARASGHEIAWTDIVRHIAEPVAASRITPIPQNVRVYADLRERYASFEHDAIG